METDRLQEVPGHIRPETLEQAFENFNQVSSTLADVYRGLEAQVNRLHYELAETRSQKIDEFEKRERIANRLQHLLNALPGGVIVLDGNGFIQECNPAAIDLLSEPLLHEKWTDVVGRVFAPRWDDGHDITLADGRHVNISTQSLDPEPGQILLIKDVTETRKLQEQLSRLKRLSAMGEMAASLAHQIRSPLSSALLYASNIGNTGLNEELKQRFIKKQIACLQHLESLVGDMLLFARGGQFDFKPCDLSTLVAEFINVQKSDPVCRNIELIVLIEQKNIVLDLNRDAFVSTLQNLFDNAAQAMAYKGKIQIELGITAAGTAELSITDNGNGIPKNIHDRLFEPFFTTKSNGTGLGLAVADAVIRAHHGKLSFITEAGVGTTFTISLPYQQNQEL